MISFESTRTMSAAEANDSLASERRRCGDCDGGTLRCVQVAEERKNGFYVGRTYTYKCTECSASLERYDGWMAFKVFGMQTIGALMFGSALVPMGLARAGTEPAMLFLSLLGLLVFASGAFSAFSLSRYRATWNRGSAF